MSLPLNVLIVRSLGAESNRKIAAVSERLHLLDATGLVPPAFAARSSRPPWDVLASTGKPGDIEASERLRRWSGEADIMLGLYVTPDLASYMMRLKWVQLVTAGVDYLPRTGLLSSDVILTTARGVSDIPIAEYIIGAILGHARGTIRCLANKSDRRWERFVGSEVNGATLGIIGLGSIGSEVARRVRSLGMHVIAFDHHATEDRAKPLQATLVPLEELLVSSDYIVLTVPLTAQTAKLIGEREFGIMKPSAFLVNVSRGAIVDEAALVRALKSGRIAGAALDVYEKEPLPPESPLWEIPNLYLSPHMSSSSERYGQRLTDLFCDNLRRYLAGEPLLNVLDKKKGY